MAGTQKQTRLLAALERRAQSTIGESASILDYVEQFVQGGGMLATLATDLAEEMGESISRPFLSNTVNNLSGDAKQRIGLARREGASALADEAVMIADAAPETSGGVQKAKLRAGMRQWLAEKHNPEQYGSKVALTTSVGVMLLEALRAPAPPPPRQLTAGADDSLDNYLQQCGLVRDDATRAEPAVVVEVLPGE